MAELPLCTKQCVQNSILASSSQVVGEQHLANQRQKLEPFTRFSTLFK